MVTLIKLLRQVRPNTILLKSLLRLYDAKIPVVIILGNHDNPMSFGKAHSLDLFKELPLAGFHVIAQPQSLLLETKSGPINIVGIPWPSRNSLAVNSKYYFNSAKQITDYLSHAVGAIIDDAAQKLDPTIPAVLAAHLSVSTGIFSGPQKKILCTELILFFYRQNWPKCPSIMLLWGICIGIRICMPKSSRRLSIPVRSNALILANAMMSKGFALLPFFKGNAEYEFIKSPMRPFIQIEVHLQDEGDQTEQLLSALKRYPLEDAIVKIIYFPPANAKDTVNIHAIQLACNQAQHLVGIIPIRKLATREQRMALKVDMDLTTLLDAYFESKPAYKEKKQRLIEQALALYELSKEVEQSE